MKKRLIVLAAALCLLLTLLPVSALAGNGITEAPQRMTALLKIKFVCGCNATGTGAIIAVDGLLTAAHNLLCRTHNERAKTIDFYFGYVSDSDYWYKYSGGFTAYPMCDFSKGYTKENDIGIVKFSKKIGDSIGWYGASGGSAYGFSGESGFVCYYNESGKLMMFKGPMSAYDSDTLMIEHKDLPASAGGAPVYYQRGAGLNSAVIGVYACTEDGQCYFCQVTSDVFQKMKEVLTLNLM